MNVSVYLNVKLFKICCTPLIKIWHLSEPMSDSEDDDFLSSKVSKKASSSKITVPDGHCLVNTKWKNTEVGQSLSKLFTVKSVGDLGVADIQPTSEVIFIVLVSSKKDYLFKNN